MCVRSSTRYDSVLRLLHGCGWYLVLAGINLMSVVWVYLASPCSLCTMVYIGGDVHECQHRRSYRSETDQRPGGDIFTILPSSYTYIQLRTCVCVYWYVWCHRIGAPSVDYSTVPFYHCHSGFHNSLSLFMYLSLLPIIYIYIYIYPAEWLDLIGVFSGCCSDYRWRYEAENLALSHG